MFVRWMCWDICTYYSPAPKMHYPVVPFAQQPCIAAPEDAVWDAMSCAEQAENAWQRHLARNRSVLVDLFHGQLMSEVTCQTCQKVSR